MELLDLTLPEVAENLALEEALLERAERAGRPSELLRLWEVPRPAVIVGRNSAVAGEVDLAACRRRNVPLVRRVSGGGAIVAGPGCLMYSLVLSYQDRARLLEIHAGGLFDCPQFNDVPAEAGLDGV